MGCRADLTFPAYRKYRLELLAEQMQKSIFANCVHFIRLHYLHHRSDPYASLIVQSCLFLLLSVLPFCFKLLACILSCHNKRILIEWLIDPSIDRFIDRFSIDRLIDWLIDWLIDCTSHRLCVFATTPPTVGERSIVMSMSVCLSVCVCVFVHDHIFGTTHAIFTKFFVYVTYYRAWFWSWSRFLAVCLQVTWVINPTLGCHYLPSGPQLPS